ncbi:MAG: ribonuclease H-like domain-containing protein [Pirellulales bacterium]|nr:ribonuclease H-like domain-containing protein [Pirellulales bacterium]
MNRKYLAFDIETAKDVPGEDFNWKPHRPLGIACAAALPSDSRKPMLWHGKTAAGTPAEKMSRDEAKTLVRRLTELVAEGYALLTWNGLGFDFNILAEESDARAECKQLALNHVDLMFHVFCDRGYPVALDKAAQALGIPGKPPGMSGLLAPRLWAQGKYQEVLDYVAHDVRIALEIALKCEQRRKFEWITRKGSKSSLNLPQGWLTVSDAHRLPEPDTSWMSTPIPRREFTAWLEESPPK